MHANQVVHSTYVDDNTRLFMPIFPSVMHNSQIRAITEFDYEGTYPQDDDPADYIRIISGRVVA